MEMSCCVICFRLEGRNDEISESDDGEMEEDKKTELFQRFFKLLERHLNGDEWDGGGALKMNSKEINEGSTKNLFDFVKKFDKLPVCEDCLDVFGSFCDLYHKIKYLELLLNWRMQTVMNIMFCAQRIPARLTCFKNSAKIELEKHKIDDRGDESVNNNYAGSIVEDKIESILQYKKYLIKKCSHKFTNGYPKLSLRRIMGSDNSVVEPVKARVEIFEQFATGHGSPLVAYEMSNFTIDDEDENDFESSQHEVGDPIPSPVSADLYIGNEGDTTTAPLGSLRVALNGGQEEINIGSFEQGLLPQLKLELSSELPLEYLHANDAEIITAPAMPPLLLVPLETQEAESPNFIETEIVVTSSQQSSSDKPTAAATKEESIPHGRRLRTKHCCTTCRKTFSNSGKLSEHQKSSVCGTSIEDSDNDEECKPQQKNKMHRISKTSEDDDDSYNENNGSLSPPSSSDDTESDEDFNTNFKLEGHFSNPVIKIKSEPDNEEVIPAPRIVRRRKRGPKPRQRTEPERDKNSAKCSLCSNYYCRSYISTHLKIVHPNAYQKTMKLRARKTKMRKHKNNYVYNQIKCTICNKQYHTTRRTFNLHLKRVHPETYKENRKERIRQQKGEVKKVRVLCPELECQSLFLDVRDMALHRKNAHFTSSNPSAGAPEANQTVSVEILKFQEEPASEEEILEREKSQFEVYARIEIPGNVFHCSKNKCKYNIMQMQQIFFFEEDFQNHSKLHGKFPCQFCDFEDNHRALARHELRHLPPEKKKYLAPSSSSSSGSDSDDEEKEKEGREESLSEKEMQVFHCPRCNYSATSKQTYHAHFSTHLPLTELRKRSCRWRCPICRIPLPADLSKEFEHLKSFHDLTDSEDVHRCSAEPDCPAYCLSSQQLETHLKAVHNNKGFTDEECKVLAKFEDRDEAANEVKISKRWGDVTGSIRYVCTVASCNLLFKRFHEMISHRKNSHPSSPEGNSLVENGNIFVEIVKFKKGGSHSNSKIGKSLNRTQRNFEVFAKFEIPGNIFSCPEEECGQQCFFFKEDLEIHSQLHGQFKCEFCDFVGTYAVTLAEHEMNKHATVPKKQLSTSESGMYWMKCPRCNDYATPHKQKYLQHHLTTYLSLQLVEQGCPICRNVCFGTGGEMRRRKEEILHYKTYHNLLEVVTTEENGEKKINYDKLHKCSGQNNNCSAYFLTKKQFHTHFKNAHTDMKDTSKIRRMFSGKVQCPTCGKISKNAGSLIGHRRLMHPELMIPCTFPQCTNTFDTQKDLESHMTRIHGRKDIEIIVCQKCGKGVCGEFHMRRHMAAHERKEKIEAGEIQVAERSWVCELCGKAFKFKEKLQNHMQTHTGPESYKFQCEVCKRKCSTKHTLQEHMRTHTHAGEKRFVCQVCGAGYAHRHNLRIHLNNKHSDVMQDIPKKFDFSNHKRKSKLELDAQQAPHSSKSKRRRRKPPKKQEESESEAKTPSSSDTE